jgi:hypothetical protein
MERIRVCCKLVIHFFTFFVILLSEFCHKFTVLNFQAIKETFIDFNAVLLKGMARFGAYKNLL